MVQKLENVVIMSLDEYEGLVGEQSPNVMLNKEALVELIKMREVYLNKLLENRVTKENSFKSTIRSTQEEINAYRKKLRSLIEPIHDVSIEKTKELEVGEWYKDPNSGYLVCVININEGTYNYADVFGFDTNGKWAEKWDTVIELGFKEATPQEVGTALTEEAKMRGFSYGSYVYDTDENELCGHNGILESVFSNGKWAEVIEVDKFAELKQAHKKGAVIQYEGVFGGWFDIEGLPSWNEDINFRIKPEKKPKVKPRLGRKQERVILDDDNYGHEICTFHEKYKHLTPLVVEFLRKESNNA